MPRHSHRSTKAIEAAALDWVARCDGGLNSAEQANLAAWIDADPRHREALVRYEAVWAAVQRPRPASALAKLGEEMAAAARRQRGRRIAAALALIVAVGALWRWPRPDPAPPMRSSVVLLLPRQQVLPDGSVIQYPAGTEFQVNYAETERRITLRKGKACFEVAKNKSRPFVVDAGGVEFRAVGTVFAVELGNTVALVVAEGKVAVDQPTTLGPDSPRSESKTVTLVGMGNRAEFSVRAAPLGVAPIPQAMTSAEIRERLAWRSPRLEFSRTPLGEVLRIVNRYGRVKFVIADPALAQVNLSGLFRADDPETLRHLLETGFGIRTEERGGEIFLSAAAVAR